MDNYVASVQERLRTILLEAQAQLTMEACQTKQYYNRKIGTVNLKPGDPILVKADSSKGKRKIKDRWEEETWEVVHQITTMSPFTKCQTSTESHMSSTEMDFFSLHQRLALLCV